MVVASSGSGKTVQDLVDETRRQVMGGLQDQVDILDGDITDAATDVVFTDSVDGLSRGAIIEIGNEEMYVRSVNSGSLTATVIRGWGRSEPIEHDDGDLIRVAPRFSTTDIFHAVIDEIAALNGTGLFAFETVEVSHESSTPVVHLDVDGTRRVAFVYNAIYENGKTFDRHRPAMVRLKRNMDTDDFTSGYAVHVVEGGDQGDPLRVTVAREFGVPTSLGQDVEGSGIGLNKQILPIVPVGAAYRLMLSKEARRLDLQSSHGSRRSEEIQPGSISFLGRALEGKRETLIASALEHQFSAYPPRTSH